MSYSSYFKKLRKDRKLSQKDLAAALGVTNIQISNLEIEKSKTIRQDLFDGLVSFVKQDPQDIAYDIFFREDPVDSNHPISEINRRYLSSLWNKDRILTFAQKFASKDNNDIYFDAVFWSSDKPYYKVLLGNFRKNKYLSAIRKTDKAKELKKTILLETMILEELNDTTGIYEFRFVLDSDDPDSSQIFKEISSISFINLGKHIDISYLLFDRKKETKNIKQSIHYVTDRKSKFEI